MEETLVKLCPRKRFWRVSIDKTMTCSSCLMNMIISSPQKNLLFAECGNKEPKNGASIRRWTGSGRGICCKGSEVQEFIENYQRNQTTIIDYTHVQYFLNLLRSPKLWSNDLLAFKENEEKRQRQLSLDPFIVRKVTSKRIKNFTWFLIFHCL